MTVFFVPANILQPLIDVFEEILKAIHGVGLGWGTSIIALTVIVRALLLPLTIKQSKSMMALARLSPQMKALQAKYKDDRQRLNQEMMRFYQEHKVNPFASCLPLLAQLPVFIALYYLLRDDLRIDICPKINPPGTERPRECGETAASEFFFIPDLTAIPEGGVLIALMVIYAASQLLSSLLTAMTSPTMDRNQKILLLALPLVFVVFAVTYGFPSGLLVYWITTNIWTAGQQFLIRRWLGPMKPLEPALAGVPGGGGEVGGPPVRDRKARGPARRTPPPSPRKKRKKKSGRRR